MPYRYDDGGRAAAGYKGRAADCVCRSVCIATGLPYTKVYNALAAGTGSQRAGKAGKKARSARQGISTRRKWFRDYMVKLGFRWVPTMGIGTGCTVHLAQGELPAGRLVVAVSKHYVAVIDGWLCDTDDPGREGTRCVYGYWVREGAA